MTPVSFGCPQCGFMVDMASSVGPPRDKRWACPACGAIFDRDGNVRREYLTPDGIADAQRLVVAVRIRLLRQQSGRSQEDVAARAGIDRTALAAIESGLRDPKLTTVFRICAALQKPPAILVAGLGSHTSRS